MGSYSLIKLERLFLTLQRSKAGAAGAATTSQRSASFIFPSCVTLPRLSST